MNTTGASIDLKAFIIKRSTPDDFAVRLRDFCQLFRFYSSVILVVVGKRSARVHSGRLHALVGMIGSMLSIKVFSSTKIRRNSSNEYLITSKTSLSRSGTCDDHRRSLFVPVSFVVALLLFNFFCDEVLRSIVHDFKVDLPLNLVDLSRPLCKCKFRDEAISRANGKLAYWAC